MLQDSSHYCDEDALSGVVRDLMQQATYLRANAPQFFNRGGRSTTLTWTEIRAVKAPSTALATALKAVETMPSQTGWLLISLPDEGRAWAVTPCAIESAGWTHDLRRGLLRLQWHLLCGPMTEIAIEAAPYALTLEIGTEMMTEGEDHYLALETVS